MVPKNTDGERIFVEPLHDDDRRAIYFCFNVDDDENC